ncbi:MAG: hypothetical protein AAF660_04960 [Pseudomonadota bacterium]
MPSVFRRHLILTLFTALAFLLVLIGWWVRPELGAAATVDDRHAVEHPSSAGMTTVPVPTKDESGSAAPATDCSEQYLRQIDEFFATLDDDLDARIPAFAQQDAGIRSSPGYLVMASHFYSDPERFALFEDGIAAASGSAHLLWTAVGACVNRYDAILCPNLGRWTDRLLALDSENALAWALAGHAYLERGRDVDALQAFRRGAVSGTVNDYRFEDIEAAMTAVASLGGYSEAMAYTIATGYAAAFAHPISHFAVCREKTDQSADWAEACLALGQTIERHAMDYFNRGVGRRLQWQARVARGEDPGDGRLLAPNAGESYLPTGLETETLRYPDSLAIFLQAYRHAGEIRAFEILLTVNADRRANGYRVECGDIRNY